MHNEFVSEIMRRRFAILMQLFPHMTQLLMTLQQLKVTQKVKPVQTPAELSLRRAPAK